MTKLQFPIIILTENNGEMDMKVVQCLKYDFVAQGKTEQEAINRFRNTVLAHIYLCLSRDEKPFDKVNEPPSWCKFVDPSKICQIEVEMA